MPFLTRAQREHSQRHLDPRDPNWCGFEPCDCDSPTCHRCKADGVRLCGDCGEKVWPIFIDPWTDKPEFNYTADDCNPRCPTCATIDQAECDPFVCDD